MLVSWPRMSCTALSNGYYLFFLAVPVGIIAASHLVHRACTRPETSRRSVGGLRAGGPWSSLLRLRRSIAAYLRVKQAQGFTRTRERDGPRTRRRPAAVSARGAQPTAVLAGGCPAAHLKCELFPGLTLRCPGGVRAGAGWRRPAGAPLRVWSPLVACRSGAGPASRLRLRTRVHGPIRLAAGRALAWTGLRVPARLAMIVYLGARRAGRCWGCLGCSRTLAAGVAPSSLHRAACRRWLSPRGCPARRTRRHPLPTCAMSGRVPVATGNSPAGPMLELPVGDFARRLADLAGDPGSRQPDRQRLQWVRDGLCRVCSGGPPSGEIRTTPASCCARRARSACGICSLHHPRVTATRQLRGTAIAAPWRQTVDHVERVVDVRHDGGRAVLRPTAFAPSSRSVDPTAVAGGLRPRGVPQRRRPPAAPSTATSASRWLTGAATARRRVARRCAAATTQRADQLRTAR